MSNKTFQCIVDTYAKKRPMQSSELASEDKRLFSSGTTVSYLSLQHADGGHVLVTLPTNENWYFYKPDTNLTQDSHVPKCAIDLIKTFEGYEKKLNDGTDRVRAYPDPGPRQWELPTIGYGTTRYPDGRSVKADDIITREEAEKCLLYEVEQKCRVALERIPTWNRMNDNQRGALYDFAYNLGAGFYRGTNFNSITKLCDSPDKWGDTTWVFAQFGKYVTSNGKRLEGLVTRRAAEARLFCTPVA